MTATETRTVGKRAVRILLECCLVSGNHMERDGTSGDGEAREHPCRAVLGRVVSAREGLHRLRVRARTPIRVELQHQRRALHAQRGAEL